ncbi:FimV/HubP family polar landmark protein [Paraburkholderia caballeronis]|uniref:FimV/HubP family polar landmark protein n=1 Tax=Paraburkholderia caballeronis TaxID=416943 RepID=UPI0010664C6D|nr:FimV/HubP family polar landmark protein [Paraburkholderia caballeronis]TDV19306.1 FimV-like protein [Paraburkholderia caballeronis]TDV21906.1 FimV-like protein [Paraburkholderia caballeronis]TDV28809.1 FimV-like protein [Paraburkholderia caballeronis]
MIVRFGSVTVAPARRAAFAAVAAALFASAGIQSVLAAEAAGGASAPASAGHYTVRVGQSLNDVAAELAQTRDPATLGRVSRALFDANPDAFMKHGGIKDPSRLKIGAVLNVPAMAEIPGGAASEPAEASTPAPAPVSSAAATTAAAPAAAAKAAGASSVVAGSAPAPAVSAASPAAAASAPATAAAGASAPATAAVAGSSAAQASAASSAQPVSAAAAASPTSAAAVAGASVPAASSGPAAPEASASDAQHVWSGAIQAAPAGASSGAAAANAASAAHPQAPVSSIQELLALKNRVLMALQKHGIGKPAQPAGGTPAAVTPAQGNATSGAAAAPIVNTPRSGNPMADLPPVVIGVTAAIGAVVLALLLGRALRRRKPGSPRSDEGNGPSPEPTGGGDARVADAVPEPKSREPVLSPVTPAVVAATAAGAAAAASAEAEPQHDETLDPATDAAGFAAATSLGADALPPTLFESPHGVPLSDEREPAVPDAPVPDTHAELAEPQVRGVEPGEPETLADATRAASFEAAAALGASALPPESVETAWVDATAAEFAPHAESEPQIEPPAPQEPEASEPLEPYQPEETVAAVEPAPPAVEPEQPVAPAEVAAPIAEAATESPAAKPADFPTDAVAALDTLDMPLPPRTGEPVSAAPLSSEPVASPETTERHAVPLHEPSAPAAGGEIEAGTTGAGSIAGLGAARFGTLSLDFDLNLPPDSAEPLPVFTPEQLARIARNKLDLANEYIALGDLAGARALITEVIESNDHATRADAQALLATLAPLS